MFIWTVGISWNSYESKKLIEAYHKNWRKSSKIIKWSYKLELNGGCQSSLYELF